MSDSVQERQRHSRKNSEHDDEEGHTHYHGVDRAEQHIGVDEALRVLLEEIRYLRPETVDLSNSLSRILFDDLMSGVDVPKLPRATRDGYAVKADDLTVGNPTFRIVGDVRIGAVPKLFVKSGEAVRVATGSYLPSGTNAVVMKEYGIAQDSELHVSRPIKLGENILRPGEDVQKGTQVMRRGAMIGPQHIALLSLLGQRRVRVFRRPRVAYFSTGDELVDINESSKMKVPYSKIFDVNRPFVRSMLRRLNTEPLDLGIIRDNFSKIRAAMIKGLKQADALILSAGSSVGERDYVNLAAGSIKGVRILVHGIAMRPSSPTGLAVYRGKPFILLPGFPTSAIVSFFVFARPAILKLSGSSQLDFPMIRAKLRDGYETRKGLKQYLRVQVSSEGGEYYARIVRPTEAYYSSWLRSANGIAVIDEEEETLKPNDEVKVFLIGDLVSAGQSPD